MKSKIFQSVCAAALLIAGTAGTMLAADSPADLSAADIVKQSQAKYASLTSYSDDGTTAATLGRTLASTFNFTTKLARTNFYEVVWREGAEMFAPKGAVWSAGDGDFLWMGGVFEAKKLKDREATLASAAGISGGASASVPGTFFKQNFSSALWTSMASGSRLPDGKVGDVDCFVVTHSTDGRVATFWIGKQDLLIRQVRNFTSGEVVKAVLEAQAKTNPQVKAMLDAGDQQLGQDVTSVEVHQHIVINQPMTRINFDFQIPATSQP